MRIIIALVFVLALSSVVLGQRCRRNLCVQPQRIVHHQPEFVRARTTVVNNLVGIPVPVSNTQPIAAQGTSVYGYSSLAGSYNQVDLGLLYNQAARLSDQAQQLAGQAHLDFAGLVQAESQSRAEVAEIVARGQAAALALQATQGGPSFNREPRSFSFRASQDAQGGWSVEPLTEAKGKPSFELAEVPLETRASELLKSKCVRCHNDSSQQGGLNLLGPVTPDQQEAIWDEVSSGSMPQSGPALSAAELEVLRVVLGK
ncbi:hypothetical protein [Bremerella sp. P1]|uniref:hypothetical protein n=1 Tax=Bremerella sp. P1 TaxID=3026424 RepID=UPI002368D0C8|nr:hypothetical protein [Bremerella sp. P1]WDI43378.1 hypothetical protein PSR63_05390 [Bremerella sp. P1]